MSILDRLLKSKQELDGETEVEGIEKSFDEAIDELNKLSKADDFVEKKKKMRKKIEDDDDYEDEEDEEDEDVEKSEDDIFIDAEPIIKSMMDKIDNRLDAIESRISSVEKISKAHAELATTEARLVKSMVGNIDEPLERKGVVKADERKFQKSENDKPELTKADAMNKLNELIKSGKINTQEVSIIESRIQRGAELPDIMYSDIK